MIILPVKINSLGSTNIARDKTSSGEKEAVSYTVCNRSKLL